MSSRAEKHFATPHWKPADAYILDLQIELQRLRRTDPQALPLRLAGVVIDIPTDPKEWSDRGVVFESTLSPRVVYMAFSYAAQAPDVARPFLETLTPQRERIGKRLAPYAGVLEDLPNHLLGKPDSHPEATAVTDMLPK